VYSQYSVSCITIFLILYNRIGVFRAERGQSRRQLAEAVEVNTQTIGYLERGDYKPSLELAMKIARHFGVAVEMLFSFERFESIAVTLRRAGADE
jgi:putative transcriptional regulator